MLDLDETLVHYDLDTRFFRVRPFCIAFLNRLAALYEIVIFTAANQCYADYILDKLDPDNICIMHRLYR